MSTKFRSLLLNASVALGMCTSVFAGPATFEQFESCDAAKDAVREAGSSGLATNAPYYVVVYDEPLCYRGNTSGFTSFAEERNVAGEQCPVGYVCEDEIPSQ
jgi:hypothetical protein